MEAQETPDSLKKSSSFYSVVSQASKALRLVLYFRVKKDSPRHQTFIRSSNLCKGDNTGAHFTYPKACLTLKCNYGLQHLAQTSGTVFCFND